MPRSKNGIIEEIEGKIMNNSGSKKLVHLESGHGMDLFTGVQDLGTYCGKEEEYRDIPQLKISFETKEVTCLECLREKKNQDQRQRDGRLLKRKT
jgi:hypothetical protein